MKNKIRIAVLVSGGGTNLQALIDSQKKGIIKSKDIKEIPWFYIGRVDWKKKITSFVGAKFFDKKYKESF